MDSLTRTLIGILNQGLRSYGINDYREGYRHAAEDIANNVEALGLNISRDAFLKACERGMRK